MLELFHENGHLTDEAIQSLIREEELDELQRLEISEHFSFCDACTSRYAELLSDDVLQSPPVPLYGQVMKNIRQKERRMFWRRLTTIATAACLALVFWWNGVFTFPSKNSGDKVQTGQTEQIAVEKQEPSKMEGIRTGLQQLTSGLGEWTQSFLEPLDKVFSKTYEKENLHGEK